MSSDLSAQSSPINEALIERGARALHKLRQVNANATARDQAEAVLIAALCRGETEKGLRDDHLFDMPILEPRPQG